MTTFDSEAFPRHPQGRHPESLTALRATLGPGKSQRLSYQGQESLSDFLIRPATPRRSHALEPAGRRIYGIGLNGRVGRARRIRLGDEQGRDRDGPMAWSEG